MDYPPLAQRATIQRTVGLTAIIGPDGLVERVERNSGHPLLTAFRTANTENLPEVTLTTV